MKRRKVIKYMSAALPSLWLPQAFGTAGFLSNLHENNSPPDETFKADWDSLKQYRVPKWFRDAKFGIWAHWGPQCQPEHGDWYARSMYMEGSDDYKFHLEKYGHPSRFGFKDVIHQWKAENWNPEELVALYKRAGAQYFMALANHHDNFDNYDSKHQPWNSTNIGPKKDLIAGWEKAARTNGLKFGVSVHAAHAWTFYEKSQKADMHGRYKGIPYDGKSHLAEGVNKWWNGLDPQALYAQNHKPSPGGDNQQTFYDQWDWSHGVRVPDKKYCDKFLERTIDLIDQYHPDMVYFDDTILPLYPISDAGLKIAAHFYNSNRKRNGGKLEAVITGKILDEQQRQCLIWDIERGHSNRIEPLPWQTCTCIGNWHYDRALYENHGYKTAKTVVQSLVDIVSKNGNLLLNIPVRGDGTIDSDERAIVEEITKWMDTNRESIFETRPWKIFGEGPSIANAAALNAQGFNEDNEHPFTAEDIRFTTKNNCVYATALAIPVKNTFIKSLGSKSGNGVVVNIELLGTGQQIKWLQMEDALEIEPSANYPSWHTAAYKIVLQP
jgi:alpha-L-fucosidase